MTTSQTLVEQYIPLANKLAYQKKRSLPNFVDVEELKSAAYMGLCEAASRYNPDFGVAFSTFAYPRVFGAIHDYLREMGWGKRSEPIQVLSLDSSTSDDKESTLGGTIEAKAEHDSDEFFEVIALSLDEQADKVLRSYFIDEHSMKEVGEQFGVSEGRISQLIKQYKERIRADWQEEELRELAA